MACLAAIAVIALVPLVDDVVSDQTLVPMPSVSTDLVADLLQMLAAGMLTVATVTLSVLILVLSIAAGNASPRAVPEVMADPVTQNALSTFLASFVFAVAARSLLGLDTIEEAGTALIFVLALLLTALAMRYLVQWIHHVADAMKMNRIIARVHAQAERTLAAYLAEDCSRTTARAPAAIPPEAGAVRDIACAKTGYVQLIDLSRLNEVVTDGGLHVRLLVREGDFVHPRMPIMAVRGDAARNDKVANSLREAVAVGAERTGAGDPLLGFQLLSEIACRALSSGVNDPQTAIICIDHLGGLLAQAGQVASADYPTGHLADGRLEVRTAAFEDMLVRAVRPVARDGAAQAEVVGGMVEMLAMLVGVVAVDYLHAVCDEARRACHFGQSALVLPADREALSRALDRLERAAAERQRQAAAIDKRTRR